jgi:hypothetical protein
VTSVSSSELAEQAAGTLETASSAASVETDVLALFPKTPRRLLCTRRVNRTTRVSIDDGLMALEMPVPDLQTSHHPTGLHWMTDVMAEDWAVIRDSRLASLLVPETASLATRARTSADGVSVLCPRAVVLGNVELEAQVPRPTIRVASVVDQVTAIGSERGFRCVPSDKGLYTLEAAELLGGLRELMKLVSDDPWLALLRALSSTKQSGHPGHWSGSDKRRYFGLDGVEALVEELGVDVSTAGLVAEGILRRGLRHHCPRCRFASWFDQEEIGRDLRCARCRREIGLNDFGWEESDEPRWRYKLHELLWQFTTHHSDLALRAVNAHILPPEADRARVPWGLGVEMDLFKPNGRQFGETDLTLTLDGSLWVGEAKSNSTLGADHETSLKRLRRVAEHLRADRVALISEGRPFPTAQCETARAVFDGAVAELSIVTVGES